MITSFKELSDRGVVVYHEVGRDIWTGDLVRANGEIAKLVSVDVHRDWDYGDDNDPVWEYTYDVVSGEGQKRTFNRWELQRVAVRWGDLNNDLSIEAEVVVDDTHTSGRQIVRVGDLHEFIDKTVDEYKREAKYSLGDYVEVELYMHLQEGRVRLLSMRTKFYRLDEAEDRVFSAVENH